MSKKLAGQVAVVTGASKGIGAAIAEHLAAAGAAVVINYASSRAGADAVVGRIWQADGNAVAVQADVSKLEDVRRLFAKTKKAFGKLDILVNNAGIYEFAPMEAINPEHFHKQFDLDVLGLLLTTQRAVKHFGQDGGTIINLSSVAATLAPAKASVYSGVKAAVNAITGSLAQELGPRKIRVNAVSPGVIETEGLHATGISGSDFEKQAVAQTPLGRIGQPQDIAPAGIAAEIAKLTSSRGVDLVFDATYSEQGFVQTAQTVRHGGSWIVLGVGPGKTTHWSKRAARWMPSWRSAAPGMSTSICCATSTNPPRSTARRRPFSSAGWPWRWSG
jgi:3-oxoacyl-[acyl-carrier protein] reductase